MKRYFFIFLVVPFILSGCLQSETKIKVDRNGAGTIERTMVLRSDVVEMMRSMQAFDTSKKDTGLLDEQKLRKDAEEMGQGVRFESVVPVKNKLGEGYRAVYSFSDISKIQISQTPGNDLPSGEMGETSSGTGEFMTFEFARGNPSALTVRLYQGGADVEEEEEAEEETGEEFADESMPAEIMEEFYKDLKILITHEVAGSVVDTNADYRSGSTITLMDMDFNALLENPEALNELNQKGVNSLEQMKEFTRKYRGVRLETKESVSVRFR